MAARATPITVIVPVRWWWALWLRATWPLARRNPLLARPLEKLRFIHFAHWGLWRRTRRSGGARLPHPYLVFLSNYDGEAREYIEHFSIKVPWRVRGMWGGAYAFPGPRPCEPFTRYVFDHQNVDGHYHCAYPQASTRMVAAGLRVQEAAAALVAQTAGADPDAFAAAWERFLADHQADL